MTPVASSNVAAVGYEAGQLYVQFHTGSLYVYHGVPVQVYQGLMSAWSHGAFLNAFVKEAGYPYRRLG